MKRQYLHERQPRRVLVLWTDGSKLDLPAVALHRLSSFYLLLCSTFEDLPETQIAREVLRLFFLLVFSQWYFDLRWPFVFMGDICGAACMLTIDWRDETIVKYVGCLWMDSSSVLRKIR